MARATKPLTNTEVKQAKVSEVHAQKLYRSLEFHVMQELGFTPVDKIRAPQEIQALKPLAAQGSLETVKRVSMLEQIGSYCERSVLHSYTHLFFN